MNTSITRRALLAAGAALYSRPLAARDKLKVAIFSKHLRFVEGDELARTVAALGFDGIDLTVRAGGHIEPERVRQDLPALVNTIRRHGVEVAMITTDIVDTASPFAEDILKTMADNGIHHYRWGSFRYTADQPFAAQLDAIKPRIAKLAAWNARYRTCALYHTHSGPGLVGASIWDLYLLLKDFDPDVVAVNYDVAHATIEGGLGGWIDSLQIVRPFLRGIGVKDFAWAKDDKGEWQPEFKPLGEGMVRFPQFFGMVAEAGFSGPLQLFFEYPLGGANDGKAQLTIGREEVYTAMKRDLRKLRAYLAQAGL